jgi:hypothetical protein
MMNVNPQKKATSSKTESATIDPFLLNPNVFPQMVRTQYQSAVRFVKILNPVNKSIDIMWKSSIKGEGKFLVLWREGVIEQEVRKKWAGTAPRVCFRFLFTKNKGGQ